MAAGRKRRRRNAKRVAALVTPRLRKPELITKPRLPRGLRWIGPKKPTSKKDRRNAGPPVFRWDPRPLRERLGRVQRSQSVRVRTGSPLHQRTPRRKQPLPCIKRPDSQTAAAKRWQYHYEDYFKTQPGFGGYHPKQLENRPAQRFFRRFC